MEKYIWREVIGAYVPNSFIRTDNIKRKMKYIYIKVMAALAIVVMLTSCGGNSTNEDGSVKESQAQIDSARNAGREAARKIIVSEWKDSMQFQKAVLEARAQKSVYEMAKRQQSVAAFDSAFISTIRATRPDLSKQLDR